MAGIILPNRFAQQPQYAARADFGHKLLSGATYVFSVLGGIPTVQTRSISQQLGDPAGIVTTSLGRGYGSNTFYFVDDTQNAVQNSGDPHTIFGIWRQLVNASSLSFGQSNNTSPNTIRLFSGGTPQYDVYLGAYRTLLADSAPAVGDIYAFAGIHTGSSQYTVLNGKRQSATGSFAGGGLGSPWTGFALGNALNAALIFGVIFKGVVPDNVIAELGRNPWQVFRAPARRLWAPSAAAAPGGGNMFSFNPPMRGGMRHGGGFFQG